MKTIIMAILVLSSTAFGAEFLIQADSTIWDTLTVADSSAAFQAKANRQERFGSLCRVEADGFEWGRRENPDPFWFLIKAPSVTLVQARTLIEKLHNGDIVVRWRAWYLPASILGEFISDAGGQQDSMTVTLNHQQVNKLMSDIKKHGN